MSKFSLSWSPSAWFLAEVNHVLAAAVIVLACARQGWNPWYAVLGIALVTGLKEFWADLTWLEHDSVEGSVVDFVCYLVGAAGTMLALFHLWAGVTVVGGACLILTAIDILDQHLTGSPHL